MNIGNFGNFSPLRDIFESVIYGNRDVFNKYMGNFWKLGSDNGSYTPTCESEKPDVIKAGGSYIPNYDACKKFAKDLMKYVDLNGQTVAFVSAMKGMTDQLIDDLPALAGDDLQKRQIYENIRKHMRKGVDGKDIDAMLEYGDLKKIVEYLVTNGEIATVEVIGGCLDSMGYKRGEDYQILTQNNEEYPLIAEKASLNGLPDPDASYKRSRELMMKAPKLTIISGYASRSKDGSMAGIRDGTDDNAAVFAKNVKAKYVLFLKDTPGIFADPDNEMTLLSEITVSQVKSLKSFPVSLGSLEHVNDVTKHFVTDDMFSKKGTWIVPDKSDTDIVLNDEFDSSKSQVVSYAS